MLGKAEALRSLFNVNDASSIPAHMTIDCLLKRPARSGLGAPPKVHIGVNGLAQVVVYEQRKRRTAGIASTVGAARSLGIICGIICRPQKRLQGSRGQPWRCKSQSPISRRSKRHSHQATCTPLSPSRQERSQFVFRRLLLRQGTHCIYCSIASTPTARLLNFMLVLLA